MPRSLPRGGSTSKQRATRIRRRQLGYAFPLDLLWSYRNRPQNDLNVVRASRAALFWRFHGRRMDIVGLRLLAWLWRFPVDVVHNLVRQWRGTQRRFGRSFVGQLSDIVRVAVFSGISPAHYYYGGLARHGGDDVIFRYVPMSLYRGAVVGLTREKNASIIDLAWDKHLFERQCRAEGIPAVETVAVIEATEESRGSMRPFELPYTDLIIKPADDLMGRGVERWQHEGGAYYASASENPISRAELLERASRLAQARRRRVLVQKCLTNNQSLIPFSGSALSTARIVTAFNEKGEPEIVDAFYRTSTAPDAAVDNFHAGGLIFPIDLATGQFKAGFADAPWGNATLTRHPTTGFEMCGSVHPGWEAMSRLALRLHSHFDDFIVVGWDIAFTPTGAVVVEANSPPAVSINRQGSFDGLVGTRMLSLLAFQARRWLEASEPPESRWRFRGKALAGDRDKGETIIE